MSSVTEPPAAIPEPPAPRTPPASDRTLDQPTAERPFIDDPWSVYRRLHRQGGPIFWRQYGLWCLTGRVAVDAALRDRRFERLAPPADAAADGGSRAPVWPAHLQRFAASERHSLLALEGREHTRLRKLVAGAFSTREVRRLEPGVRQLAQHLLDALAPELESGGTVDLLTRYAAPMPVTVIARLLGVPDAEADSLRRWSAAMVKVYTMTQSADDDAAAERAAGEFIERIEALIALRRAQPRDDLVSRLLALRNLPRPLLDAEIVSTAILLLNAGHEATVHQAGNAILSVLEHDARDPVALFDTPERRSASVQEATRHRAPLHLFVRHAQHDVTLDGGVTLGAGERLGLLLGAANRDPAAYPEPDRFQPDRTGPAPLAFGAGVHYCLGVQLARLELGIALQTLFERFPTLRLAEPARFADTFHFHGLESLRVRL